MDHFTRWAGALAIPESSAPTVVWALNQHVFCYYGLHEQILMDQGAPFLVPVNRIPLPDLEGKPESDQPISPTRERSHGM